jgi:DNA helicase-2/ATP-dependent DNA helicase PcrA
MHNTSDGILDRLNPAQRLAVTTVDGPLLVLAGPGSGKTRVITHRIAYLIGPRGVPAWQILAVTFTNKAAREMVERLKQLAPLAHDLLSVGTFHATCARILRRDGAPIGVPRNFTIADEDDQESIVRRAVKDLDLDDKRNPPRLFLYRISAAKSKLIGPDEFSRAADTFDDEQAAVVYKKYQESLEAANLLDFDDLIVRTVDLFRGFPDVLERYQERYRYLLVDEFQDTNQAQYALVRLLGSKHRNVCVVGDEDQSVYSWRQADIRNILSFESDFHDAQTIVLEQNYRSTRTILQAARSVIAPNRERKEKRLFTENEIGDRIVVFEAYDENEEANYVATQIQRALAAGTIHLGDTAVMYRVNSLSRVFEKAFLRYRIPHKVVGMRFYERKEVRDLLAYLRLVHNPQDEASFDRIVNVPARQIGAKTLADLRNWASRLGCTAPEAVELLADGTPTQVACPLGPRPRAALIEFGQAIRNVRGAAEDLVVGRLIERILDRTGYLAFLRDGTQEGESREENVRELIRVADEFSSYEPAASLAAFLEDAALAADADEYDASADAVTLITLHAAKGLEFGTVFIVGLEEGMCPHSRSLDEPRQLEEERRLLYVGLTRARRRLYLTYAARRSQFGSESARIPSRFFKDIPGELLQGTASAISRGRRDASRPTIAPPASPGYPRSNGSDSRLVSRPPGPPATPPPAPKLRPGDRVVHGTFGEGVVISADARGDDQEVAVAFQNLPIKRLLASYAKLRIISE